MNKEAVLKAVKVWVKQNKAECICVVLCLLLLGSCVLCGQ